MGRWFVARAVTARSGVAAAAAAALVAALAACSAPHETGLSLARVDPQDATDRAVEGGVLGGLFGAGVGASFAINPGLGAIVGTEVGVPIGAAIGVATARPLPDYKPIPVPTAAATIPHFYDTWPPGYHMPSIAAQAPPPPG